MDWKRIKEKYSYYEIYEIILRRLFASLPVICSTLLNRCQFIVKRVHCEGGFSARGIILISNGARIPFTGPVNVEMGRGIIINSSRRADAIGGDTKTIIRTITTKGRIEIGDYTGISNSAIIAQELIRIGSNVKIGGGVKIYDTDFHALDAKDRKEENDNVKSSAIIIEDDVFIGAHSIILKGVTIGRKAIVGAGSVVSKSIPEGEVWAGNPARCIRKIIP